MKHKPKITPHQQINFNRALLSNASSQLLVRQCFAYKKQNSPNTPERRYQFKQNIASLLHMPTPPAQHCFIASQQTKLFKNPLV